jgi:hypothetical protein
LNENFEKKNYNKIEHTLEQRRFCIEVKIYEPFINGKSLFLLSTDWTTIMKYCPK